MCPHGREASVCFTCVTTTRRRQDAPESPSLCGGSPGGRSGISESLSDANLPGKMRDAASEGPLAEAQRRLGKRGPKPSHSRYARYRKRHPEYLEWLRFRPREIGRATARTPATVRYRPRTSAASK